MTLHVHCTMSCIIASLSRHCKVKAQIGNFWSGIASFPNLDIRTKRSIQNICILFGQQLAASVGRGACHRMVTRATGPRCSCRRGTGTGVGRVASNPAVILASTLSAILSTRASSRSAADCSAGDARKGSCSGCVRECFRGGICIKPRKQIRHLSTNSERRKWHEIKYRRKQPDQMHPN
jgi:hypothetical protein